MKKIALNIMALTNHEMQSNGFVVVLREKNGYRRLPVVIGEMEAQSIFHASGRGEADRPLAHDVQHELLERCKILLEEVVISELRDHVFFAVLRYRSGAEHITIDSRTSDALALAIRAGCPIFTTPEVMEEAGISWKPQKDTIEPADFSELSEKRLNELLEEAIEAEDFERAARIRDELSKRD